MNKQAKEQAVSAPAMSKQAYKHTLRQLQIELVKLQRHFIRCDDKILIHPEANQPAQNGVSK